MSLFNLFKKPFQCPYCHKELPFIPKATRKCPFCEKKMKLFEGKLWTVQKLQDYKWGLFNQQLNQAMRKNDFNELRRIYLEMADFLEREGKNNSHILQLARKMQSLSQKEELLAKQQDGFKKVEILANQGCPECLKQNGKIYSIDQALKEMPLPNKNCCHQYGYCRCSYISVIDDELMHSAFN